MEVGEVVMYGGASMRGLVRGGEDKGAVRERLGEIL